MRPITLIKSYERLGYIVKGYSYDDEYQSIIKWLYDTYNIFLTINYCDMKFDIKPSPYMKFKGSYRYNCSSEHSSIFYCKNNFSNAYDAYFDVLREALPGFRFNVKYDSNFKNKNIK